MCNILKACLIGIGLALVMLFGGFIGAVDAQAQARNCTWKWDCTGDRCIQVPICRNNTGLVPVRPIQMPPMTPLKPVRPIEAPRMPPMGTRYCEQRYICEDGKCGWKQVCR